MSEKRHELAMLVNEYKAMINLDLKNAEFIVENLGNKVTEELYDDIYNSAIIKMCIQYEAFTSDAYGVVVDHDIHYNHPWDYTRKIAKKLQLHISDEYDKAHYAWEYYNALKHSNKNTRMKLSKFRFEHMDKTTRDIAVLVNKLLNDLLDKFR